MGKRKCAAEDGVETSNSAKEPKPLRPPDDATTSPKHSKKTKVSEEALSSPAKDAPAQSTAQPTTTTPKGSGRKLILKEKKGDLFAAPPNTLLVHACNTKGLWGAGIAASFRSRYRTAFKANKHHCATRPQSKLPGTSLLTPPDKTKVTIDDEQLRGRPPTDSLVKATHFIGNLYTSRGVGRKKDTKDVILQYTGPAMRDLLERVADWNAGDPQRKIERIWLCKINSGLFGVKWEETREVLRSVEVPDGDVPAEVLVLAKD